MSKNKTWPFLCIICGEGYMTLSWFKLEINRMLIVNHRSKKNAVSMATRWRLCSWPAKNSQNHALHHEEEKWIHRFFEQKLDVSRTLAFLDDFRSRTGLHATMLHLLIYASTQMIKDRPYMNRFVAGDRIFQRRGIWISFSVKKRKTEDPRRDPVQFFWHPHEYARRSSHFCKKNMDTHRPWKETPEWRGDSHKLVMWPGTLSIIQITAG